MTFLQTSFKLLTATLLLVCVLLTFLSVDGILCCYHSNKTFLAELLHGNIYFLGCYKNKFDFFV